MKSIPRLLRGPRNHSLAGEQHIRHFSEDQLQREPWYRQHCRTMQSLSQRGRELCVRHYRRSHW